MFRNITLVSSLCTILFGGCAPKKEVGTVCEFQTLRQDNLLIDDRYILECKFYHRKTRSIEGKYIVRAYGDVFGNGGEENQQADNYDESSSQVFAPGKANAFAVHYYINDPELKANNLSVDQVMQATDIRIEMEFTPTGDSAKTFKRETNTFLLNGGKYTDTKRDKAYRRNTVPAPAK